MKKNIYKIEKEQIYCDVEYFEISNDQSVFIVFVNNSSLVYSIKTNSTKLENLTLDNKNGIISIKPYKFEYIKLKKRLGSQNNFYFILQYSIKKH